MKRIAPLLLLSLYLCACSKGSEQSEQEETKPNQPPSAFQVSVSNVSPKGASLNWTTATDPEGGTVLYSVVIGSDTVSRKQSASTYTVTNLPSNTAYAGSIIAYDSEGNQAKAAFSFSTTDHPAPSDFIVSLTEVGRDYTIISWTASTLPNNAPVTYDVYLNNQLVAPNITTTTYTFQSLNENTSYTPKVVAKSSEGKSTERTTLPFRTLENTTPTKPVLTTINTGFSEIQLSFTAATAPSGNTVEYALFLDGQLYRTPSSLSPNQPVTIDWLMPGTSHTVYIAAFTRFRDSSKSNTVTFTTHTNPAPGPLSLSENGSTFALKFKKGTTAPIKSLTLINNGNIITATPTSVQANGDEVTVTYPRSVLSPGVKNNLKLELEWGWGYPSSVTSQVSYTYYNFTATTVTVADAWITTSPFVQFNILFTNSIISEYDSWEVIDVAFEQYHYGNLLMPGLGAPNKTYITGNLTLAQAENLRSGSKGYVIIKDASGYHKHEFTYTFK